MTELAEIQARRNLGSERNGYPRFLYKFHSVQTPQHLRSIIVDSTLYLSGVEDFHDPFECSAIVDTQGSPTQKRNQIRRMIKRLSDFRGKALEAETTKFMTLPDMHEQLVRAYKQTIEGYGITCLAETRESIPMWVHYADKHEGVCFQFELIRDPDVFCMALPVTYSLKDNRYPTVRYFTNLHDDMLKGVLTKHRYWEYERERRIIMSQKKHYSLAFKAAALRAIIYGYKTKTTTIAMIQEMLNDRRRLKMPYVLEYKATKSDCAYKLPVFRYRTSVGAATK